MSLCPLTYIKTDPEVLVSDKQVCDLSSLCPIHLYNLSDGLLIAFDTLLTTTASLPTYLDRAAYGCLPHHSQLQWPLMALPPQTPQWGWICDGLLWTTPYGAVKWPIAEKSLYWGRSCVHVLFGWLSWRGQTVTFREQAIFSSNLKQICTTETKHWQMFHNNQRSEVNHTLSCT